ncbi:two-CW domain-containing protein [Methanosphaerula subterraneus]|uniref:two-CW domain-containing protein n=1 Tax=Methanosphaerula subterraneus TaxID=3350244 RepID=UPI003F86CBA5
MTHENCWEFKECGREPGGENVSELGICPASTETLTDGMNHGKNGGRACWAISGTMCEGRVQGTLAAKIGTCLNCEFYQRVQREEKPRFETSAKILERLNK